MSLLFKIALIASWLILAPLANATELVFEDQLLHFKVTLTDQPCLEGRVKSQIKPELQKFFQSGSIIWEGEKLALCWGFSKALFPKEEEYFDSIWIIDETGDNGFMKYILFAPKDTI